MVLKPGDRARNPDQTPSLQRSVTARSPVRDAPYRIRLATPGDAPELARLRFEFRSELDPPTESESTFRERCAAWMRTQLESAGVWRCWVAVDASSLVGTAWLQLIEKLPNPVGHLGYHGYVSSVYVVPWLRNAGIGSALLQACLTEAQTLRIDALFLWPTDRSRPLYERHGFAVSNDLLERR